MTSELADFFEQVIQTYKEIAPDSTRAYMTLDPDFALIDHIAFRTFDKGTLTLQTLGDWFVQRGYHETGSYYFPLKHVRAKSYSHPNHPRVFVSELIVSELSPRAQEIIDSLIVQGTDVPWCTNPHRKLTALEVVDLLSESEYAAWVALNGLKPNHLTVAVTERIETIVESMERQGFRIAAFGGKVKGGPEMQLEQGSTIADVVSYVTSDNVELKVASSYCEFARRWDGFDAFVEPNASRIFESTDIRLPQKALAIIKPDAVRRELVTPLLMMLLSEGFEIENLVKCRPDRGYLELLYAEHKTKDFFEGQIEFMTSGDLVLIKLSAVDCASRLRNVVKRARNRYGTSIRENVIHGSDSPEAGEREVGIFFGQWQINKS